MNMNHLLSISNSGLKGLQTQLDVTATNIANVNTVGYKKNDASFQELLHNNNTTDEVRLSNQATNQSMSRGVKVFNQSVNFVQGSLMNTSSSWDMAIEGDGFFGIRDANNQLYLTRAGNFHRDAKGMLISSNGMKVNVEATIPEDQWPQGTATVSATGDLTIQTGNQSVTVGKIVLYKPANNESLKSVGSNLFQAQPNQPLLQSTDQPAEFGRIHNYQLENSSVNLADSMTDLIVAQRAYSMNLKALSASDEMASVINRMAD